MKALSLFIVLATAKLAALAGKSVDFSGWLPMAYLGQDAALCLIFGLVEATALRRHPRAIWILYAAIVVYVAANLPLMRLFASPLTWPMIHAAGQTIGDSILYYCTPATWAGVTLILAVGFVAPLALVRWRISGRLTISIVAVGLGVAVLGPHAAAQIETAGLYRNPILTLAALSWLKPGAHSAPTNWTGSPERLHVSPLSSWQGRATNRHVVLILLESTGARWLQSYGATNDPMPNLSRLSASSIQCQNAYAVYPESIKGLFSVLLSRYPPTGRPTPDYEQVRTPSLASELKSIGYRTALFHSGRFGYLNMNGVIQQRGFDVLADAGTIGGNHESSFGIDEFATVGKMLSWVDTVPAGDRFFLTYLPIAGHHPYETTRPGPFAGDDESTRYLNALYEADAAWGQLYDGLESRGLATQTLFVVMGDHGEAFGQHSGNYGHTFFLYEENLHVPFFVMAPGLIEEKIQIDWPMSLIDTAPTILGLLGRQSPSAYQGQSLLQDHSRISFFSTDYSQALLGLREGCWKFIYALETGRSQLFDLSNDPAEKHDLSMKYPAKATAYRQKLLRF